MRSDPSERDLLRPSRFSRAVARVAGVATRGEPPRVFTALGRHPRVFRRWLPLSATLLLRSELPRRDVELVILRTAWTCGGDYEWVQHVPLARRAGLSRAAVAHVPSGAGWDGWSRRQKLLLQAVDELHAQQSLTAPTAAELQQELTVRQLIELCFLVGSYETLAMTLATLGVEPEPTALAKLDAESMDRAVELRQFRSLQG